MAKLSDVRIAFEIEPVVKLFCRNIDCRFNMTKRPNAGAFCSLKVLEIDETGRCKMMEE
uniref:Uncharacterized protein n=1 Tax=viral metagenome TaxID=1070528 RepID=A0A6M3JRZ7_9ZZZZ